MRKNAIDIAVPLIFLAMLTVASATDAQDFRSLSSTISGEISASGRKTVAVTDFTDLDGNPTKLGRFLAEEFSDSLFAGAKGFDVIDRTHLKAILQEHKLYTTGLIDPATARKLGQIAGVETLVTGTLTPFEEYVHLSLKVIDTETARIIAASTTDVPKTKTIIDLIASDDGRSGKPGGADPSASDGPSQASSVQDVTRDGVTFSVRGCQNTGGAIKCMFGVTNKADSTRSLSFQSAFIVDDQGRQYNEPELNFASKTNWLDNATDLIPGVTVSLILSQRNFPDSAETVAVQISYGMRGYVGQLPSSEFISGKVAITHIPVSH